MISKFINHLVNGENSYFGEVNIPNDPFLINDNYWVTFLNKIEWIWGLKNLNFMEVFNFTKLFKIPTNQLE